MGQADLLEQTGRIERVGVEAGELRQHVAGALVAGKPGALQHHPDALGEGLVIGHRVQPVDPHLARRRPAVSLAAFDRRRLARSVGSQNGGDGTEAGGERQAIDRDDSAVADREVVDLDCDCHDR